MTCKKKKSKALTGSPTSHLCFLATSLPFPTGKQYHEGLENIFQNILHSYEQILRIFFPPPPVTQKEEGTHNLILSDAPTRHWSLSCQMWILIPTILLSPRNPNLLPLPLHGLSHLWCSPLAQFSHSLGKTSPRQPRLLKGQKISSGDVDETLKALKQGSEMLKSESSLYWKT